MRKQNLLSKKIGKQISTINNLLENYFNSLRRFILDARRLRFDKNNRVFLTIVSIIFLTLIYFLIPTAYNKELIEKEIKNQIYQKYNLAIKFDNEVQYNFFPKPHFSSKNLSILNDLSKVGDAVSEVLNINKPTLIEVPCDFKHPGYGSFIDWAKH